MAKGIKRLLSVARKNVSREITKIWGSGGVYARGLAGEGYYGGYRDALDDVSLALNGCIPRRNGWWEDTDGQGN